MTAGYSPVFFCYDIINEYSPKEKNARADDPPVHSSCKRDYC